jgi:tripartite-type tricarboxylate transporter receptor subunit TctC
MTARRRKVRGEETVVKIRAFFFGVFAAVAVATTVAAVEGCEAAQLYENKTIDLVIGYAAGGGYDIYGRLVARHLGRHLPGNPVIVPRNMPGAGSITAANYIYNNTPKDGTTIGIVTQTLKEEELLETPGFRYEAGKFTWIGRVTSNVNLSVTWQTSKVKTIEDAMKHEVPVASNLIAGVLPAVLNNVVGTKFKLINGYAGSNEGMLAMERGETDGAMTTWDTLKVSKNDWLNDKKVNILVQYAPERHRELPAVPTMVELAKTPEDRQILELFSAAASIGRSFIGPPGIPGDRIAALREGFQKMLKDPEFLAEIEKLRLDFDPMSGEKLHQLVDSIRVDSPAVRERARAARDLKG